MKKTQRDRLVLVAVIFLGAALLCVCARAIMLSVRDFSAPSPSPALTTTPAPRPAPTSAPTPMPTPTQTPAPTPSPRPAPTPTPTPTPTPKPSPTPTPKPSPTPSPTPAPTPTPSPTPAPKPYYPPKELAASQAVNPDVIAWLEIPGTEICYPILQHPTEENHYLNITIEGGSGYPGSIYTNPMEGRDFNTFNTVIYGHNMADRTYFGSLRDYHDRDFLEAHREIDVYTPTEKHEYKIFAVVIYDDRYITADYDDSREADREAYLRSLRDFDPVILDDVPVSTDGHIVTLSTCVAGMPYNRLLIVAAEQE